MRCIFGISLTTFGVKKCAGSLFVTVYGALWRGNCSGLSIFGTFLIGFRIKNMCEASVRNASNAF